MPILTIWISISWGLPLSLKTYGHYYRTSTFCIVYKYVSVSRVISNIYILANSLVPFDVIHKWVYCTSPYNRGIPPLHLAIRVLKTSQLIQLQRISGSRDPLGNLNFTPYPESQGGGIFCQKCNQNTLRLRESGNYIPPTVITPTVRCFLKTFFHNYNLITLRILHTYQRHIPRDCQWYDDHPQQVMGGWELKTRHHWLFVTTMIKPFIKGWS